MAKTLLDLDEDLLAEATVALGTRTKKETVVKALHDAVESSRARRRRTLLDLQQIAEEGGFAFERYHELDE